ncbi:MAG: hypothetical protein WAK48_29165 [Candidatus Acidiferrum sp.]|jgi:hypothetical protein
MFDSVVPAEREPISVVSSRWLWAAWCVALIYTISLVGEYVAAEYLLFITLDGVVAVIADTGKDQGARSM